MKKIVIAVDSFKTCLSSAEAGAACAEAVKEELPSCETIVVPVSDGGEGLVDAITGALGGTYIICEVAGPLMRPVKARYGVSADGSTAIVEMAAANGLSLIKPHERNPMETSSFGTGQLIMDAIKRGCTKILVGLGGSATNDGGMGMLQALGYKFRDHHGNELGQGGKMLALVDSIDSSDVPSAVKTAEFSVICDVSNPFYGSNGAAHVFARQKGADDEMIERLDQGLRHFASKLPANGLRSIDNLAGAGAAGGLGGAFAAFLGARLQRGIDAVLDTLKFNEILNDADLVITGEGRLDAQTSMGKAPYGIMQRALRLGIPTIAVAGTVENARSLNESGFLAVLSIQQSPVTLQQAMNTTTAVQNIITTIKQAIRITKKLSN